MRVRGLSYAGMKNTLNVEINCGGVKVTNGLKGPSVPLLLTCLVFLALTFVSFWGMPLPEFGGYIDKNFYGFLFGGFLGVLALARFEYVEAFRRASRRAKYWKPQGRSIARCVTAFGWVLSVFHSIFWIRELTRIWGV